MGSSTNYLIWRQISLFNLAVRQFVKCLCTFKNLFEKRRYVTCTSLVYIAGGKWEHIPPGAGNFPPFAQHYSKNMHLSLEIARDAVQNAHIHT